MIDDKKDLLNDFLEEERLKGSTSEVLKGLKYRIPKFFVFLESSDLPLNLITPSIAGEYQGWLIETGRNDGKKYKPNTIRSYIVAVSSFYNYLKRKSKVITNPFLDIRMIRQELKVPRNVFKEGQMDDFLNSLKDFNNEKDLKQKISTYKLHLISELMYATGLRISEAGNLKVPDIDLVQGTVKVRCGKGQRERTAFLNSYTKEVLNIYMQNLRGLVLNEWNKKNDYLFGISPSTFKKFVNKHLKRKCIKKKLPDLRSHGFRHALGFHLLRSGCDVRFIQAILGHESLHSTSIYTKVEKEDLKKMLDEYHPRTFKRGGKNK